MVEAFTATFSLHQRHIGARDPAGPIDAPCDGIHRSVGRRLSSRPCRLENSELVEQLIRGFQRPLRCAQRTSPTRHETRTALDRPSREHVTVPRVKTESTRIETASSRSNIGITCPGASISGRRSPNVHCLTYEKSEPESISTLNHNRSTG
jgi:hypothetical protein